MIDNTIINGLWVGNQLSPLELLTLQSFVDHGHQFYLWVYENIQNKIPTNVILKDANEIVPHRDVFTLKYGDEEQGFGKGSLALFADWFRYNLLFEKGGWWVDMDVTCLKPLDIKSDYYFRAHPILPMIGNVMKCPKQAPFLQQTIHHLNPEKIENTIDWLLPNKVLNEQVKAFQLEGNIKQQHSNLDNWQEVEAFVFSKQSVNPDWKFIHWMNEEWRAQNINKTSFYKNTSISQLMKKHGVDFQIKPKNKSYYLWHLKKNKVSQQLKAIIKGASL